MIYTPTIDEVLTQIMKPVVVEWQSDDGEWFDNQYANEAAAVEFEKKLDKFGNAHRRAS